MLRGNYSTARIDYRAARPANDPASYDYGRVRLNYCPDRIDYEIARLSHIKARYANKAAPTDYDSATIKNCQANCNYGKDTLVVISVMLFVARYGSHLSVFPL